MGLTAGPGCMWEHPPTTQRLRPGALMDPRETSLFIATQEALSIVIPPGPASQPPAVPPAVDWIPVAPVGHHSSGPGTCGRVQWTCTGGNAEAIFRRGPLCAVLMAAGWGLGGGVGSRGLLQWSGWQLRDVDMAPFVLDSSRGGFIKPTRFLSARCVARAPVWFLCCFPSLRIGG